jgi:hypothetical protein
MFWSHFKIFINKLKSQKMKTILSRTLVWQPNGRLLSCPLSLKLVMILAAFSLSFNAAISSDQTVAIGSLPVVCSSTTSITLTATVSPAVAEGSVHFTVDGSNAGTVTGSGETFSVDYNPSGLSAGSHAVAAIYTDPSGATVTSPATSLVLNGINPGLISKGAGNQGGACGPFNPSITLAPNNSTSKAASGSGTISYLWQRSDDGITWISAPIVSPETSNTAVQFNPGAMSSSTWLRRIGTSTLNSVSCSAYSNELFYEVYPSPVVSATTPSGSPNVCEGSTVQLMNVTPGGVWSSRNLLNVTVSETGKVTGLAASAQSNSNVSYTVTNSYGCSRSVNKTVRVIAIPVVSAPVTLCIGQTYNLTPSTGGSWISNDKNIATVTATGQIMTVSEGSVSFTFTGSTSPNCSNTTNVVTIVSKPQPPTLMISDNCDGTSTLTASDYNYDLLWSTGENTATITVNSSGSYSVTQNRNGCSSMVATGTTNPKQKPQVPVVISSIETCVGKTAQPLEASGTALVWYGADVSTAGSNDPPIPNTDIAGTYEYFVTQTVDGCESERAKISVVVNENCAILPVTLIEITAKPEENNVIVFWRTVYELNSDKFEIQRSTDPVKGFDAVGLVTSKNKRDGESYEFKDRLVPSTKNIYYRLKMVDLDGTYAYSRIVVVNNKDTRNVILFPNPVSDYFQIVADKKNEVSGVSIKNIEGKLIRHFDGNSITTKYDVSKLAEGSYLIEIEYKHTQNKTFKIFIAR